MKHASSYLNLKAAQIFISDIEGVLCLFFQKAGWSFFEDDVQRVREGSKITS